MNTGQAWIQGLGLLSLLIACLLSPSVNPASAQSKFNSTFDSGLDPWVPTGDVSYQSGKVRLGPAGRITIQGKFFGEGLNVVLLSAAGLRTSEDRTAQVEFAGGFPGNAFGKTFDIPTGRKPPNASAAANGTWKDFVWVPVVMPTGDGTGSFYLRADPYGGALLDNVYILHLISKLVVGPGKAAGIASLAGSFTSSSGSPILDLNGETGALAVTGTLMVGAYPAQAGLGSITVEARGSTGGLLSLWMYDFQQGQWVDPRAKPGSGLNVSRIPAPGWPFGKTFSKVTLSGFHNPSRFIDPASMTVVMKISPSTEAVRPCPPQNITGVPCPPSPPPSVELRNFNILP